MKGARKEAYKKLNRKITDFGWGWPGQVPASEKVSRELKDGKDLLCVDPKKSPQAKGAAGTNAPKQATPAGQVWLDPWWRGRGGLSCREKQWPGHSGLWIS